MKRFAPMVLVAGLAVGCTEEVAPPEIIRPVLSTIVQPVAQTQQGFVGTVEPQISASLAFRLLGRLVSRDVGIGDAVQKGAVIALLDDSALRLQVQAAKADAASAEAQLTNATASEERQKALLDAKSAPQAVYDAALQALQSARANRESAQAELSKAEEQLGYAQLFSDFDGVVTAVGAEVGQVVSPGQTVVTVARSDARDAVVDVPEQTAATLKNGDSFKVALQSATMINADATVREIAPQADTATRTRRVKLAIANPPQAFRLGSMVSVSRVVASQPTVLLPSSALVKQGEAAFVWIVDPASSTVKLRPITLGAEAPGFFSVTAGLDAGARVVTAGVNSLKDGQKVKLDVEEPAA